jgi:hypothetical protein
MKIFTYLVLFSLIASANAEVSVSVFGLSESPVAGKIVLEDNSSILDVLAHVGGLGGNSVSNVKIQRPKGSIYVVDCILSLKESPYNSFPIEDGDIVFIGESILGVGDYDYFNRLLFEWAYLKSTGRKVDARWQAQAALMTATGRKKK